MAEIDELNSATFTEQESPVSNLKDIVQTHHSDKSDSEDEIFTKSRSKSRIQQLVDTDSDDDLKNTVKHILSEVEEDPQSSDNSSKNSELNFKNSRQLKRRIVLPTNSDSDESDSEINNAAENNVKSTRIKNKRDKFDQKFKELFTKSKKSSKSPEDDEQPDLPDFSSKLSHLVDPETSDSEKSSDVSENEKEVREYSDTPTPVQKSIGRIKSQKMSKNMHSHDNGEENGQSNLETFGTIKSRGKESGPSQRMSAKQAMEQMHKIKSESGRMLREKEVSLPYHRPKQVSLKDILAKRKNNITFGNKRLGFKMNEEQLKEYEQQLKEREKDMLELCKSESEPEDDDKSDIKENLESEIKCVEENIDNSTIVNLHGDEPEKMLASDHQPTADVCKNLMTLFQSEENTDESKKTSDGCDLPESSNDTSKVTLESHCPTEIFQHVDSTQSEKSPDKICEENNDDFNISHSSKVLLESYTKPQDMPVDETKDDFDLNIAESDADNVMEEGLMDDLNKEDCEQTNKHSHFNTQPIDLMQPSTSSQNISCSVPLPNIKPKLTGSPGCFIDLISGEVQSGVEMLKKKYLIHAAMKTPEEIQREKERRIHPGSSLIKLKKDLEDKMTDHRTQEWTKRLEEMALKKKEEDDNLSECEEFLDKEEGVKTTCKVDIDEEENENDSDSEAESEPEENDIIINDKPKDKCAFGDEEAEVEDDENAGSDDEAEDSSSDDSDDEIIPTEGKKTLTRIIKAFDSDSSDDESTLEKSKPVDGLTNSLKKQSDGDFEHTDVLSTPMKKDKSLNPSQSEDMFDSQMGSKNDSFSIDWEDELLPPGQLAPPGATPVSLKKIIPSIPFSEPSCNLQGRSDLSNLVSPIIKLTAVQRMSSANTSITQTPSPISGLSSPKYKSPHEAEKLANLQKKLLFDSEGSELQDTQELENLCSGKFPTQNTKIVSCKPTDITMTLLFDKDSEEPEMTQNTENELLGLCTGKFKGINDDGETTKADTSAGEKDDSQNISLIWSEAQNTESFENAIPLALDPPKIPDLPILPVASMEILPDPIKEDDDRLPDSTKTTKTKDNSITSFFKTSSKSTKLQEPTENGTSVELSDKVSNGGRKFVMLSTSEEETDDVNEPRSMKKVLKSKKERSRKIKQLKISDDEESEEEDIGGEISENDEAEADRLVDYDSEENEIEVQPEVLEKPKKKMTSEFFEKEAELTSEDEWRASGDEDEKGLDRMEREEGDDDQFDQRAMKKQLERIHLRQILDDDKREVQMLQEMLLEDDMEGGTRERKFRWKNVDNSLDIVPGFGEDDADLAGFEDLQSEEQWRKQRHERETFLRQLMEKENTQISNSRRSSENSSAPVFKKTFKSTLIKTQVKKFTASSETVSIASEISLVQSVSGDSTKILIDAPDKNKKRPLIDVPEPAMKAFLMQNNVRGSFLSRGQAALNRLALLTKNGPQVPDSDEPTNLSSLAPGKKKNFVFATVSPPCNKDSLNEDSKLAKRKATSDISTPVLSKKTKVADRKTTKSRKSLMDHLD